MFENIKLALQGIWSHKMRSLLTMLGIIIGIASIISIVSTIKGTNEQIKQNLVGSGTNAVTITLYQGDWPYDLDWNAIPDGIPPMNDAVRTQVAALETVQDASIYTERTYVSNVFYGNAPYNGVLRGIDDHYFGVNGYSVCLGRSFTDTDYKNYNKVVIVDETAAHSIFPNENPIGKVLEIAKEPFMVIGMARQTNENEPVINNLSDYDLYMKETSGAIFVPDVQWGTLFRYDEPQRLCLKATSTDDMTAAGQQAVSIINNRIPNKDDTDISYQSNDISKQAHDLQQLTMTTNLQLIWIASISLLVGGIGVMNIMLVSVTERTREIGLKKAIGAREGRILWQFLTEAAVLTSFGGILGVAAGVGLSKIISQLTGAPSAISIPASLFAVLFSMLIGVVFGLLPAVKAARLNPIDALRRE